MKNLILIVLLITSCSIGKDLNRVVYRYDKNKYYLKIPTGYKIEIKEVTVEKEELYLYSDSSFIYITNFHQTPNYENIMDLGDSIFQFRFQNKELVTQLKDLLGDDKLKAIPDSFELSGIANDSLYWKDIKVGIVSIGYCNVLKKNKELFDQSLKSFKLK